MNEDLSTLDEFENLVDGIVTMWSLWEDAFASETGGVLPEPMYEIGREFFEYSRWAMLNYVILALCRLGSDPDSSRVRGEQRFNLTVNRVLSETEFGEMDETKNEALELATKHAESFTSLVGGELKLLRNRCISHNDLATISGQDGLPEVEISDVRRGVHCLRRFQDAILAAQRGSKLDPDVAWGADATRRSSESVGELRGVLKAEVERRYNGEGRDSALS